MRSAVDHCSDSLPEQSFVLMARLVDRQGRSIRPALVQSIEYSLFQLNEGRKRRRPVVGHIARPLSVDEVVSAELLSDESWDVDCSGYNFRHELTVAESAMPAGRGDALFELCYLIRNTTGEESLISFRGRMFSNDRP